MLTALFPKYHRRYLESPVADWLADFADWLVFTGYAHDPAHDHVRRLKQVLEARGSVTPDAVFSVAELATMFASPHQQPQFSGTRRAFECFLAANGRLVVEPIATGLRFDWLSDMDVPIAKRFDVVEVKI